MSNLDVSVAAPCPLEDCFLWGLDDDHIGQNFDESCAVDDTGDDGQVEFATTYGLDAGLWLDPLSNMDNYIGELGDLNMGSFSNVSNDLDRYLSDCSEEVCSSDGTPLRADFGFPQTVTPQNTILSSTVSESLHVSAARAIGSTQSQQNKPGLVDDESVANEFQKLAKSHQTRSRKGSYNFGLYCPPPLKNQTPPTGIKRSNVHGYNPKTGERTLVGTYPPIRVGNVLKCPDPRCLPERQWTSKNGYKYHLQNVCLQNPLSVRSLKIADGEIEKTRTTTYVQCSKCLQNFKSENGLRLHMHENQSTKDGRCLKRRKNYL